MKKLLSLFAFAAIAISATAQTTWCTQWNVLEYRNHMDGTSEGKTYIFVAAGDTTIAANTYTKIVRYWSLSPDEKEYIAAIRTQGDSLLVHYEHADYLLCDFGVKVGDERDVFAGINNMHLSYTKEGKFINKVTAVSTLEDGRRKITVNIHEIVEGGDGYIGSTDWIEGVGCTDGLLYTGACGGRTGSYGYALLCASNGDNNLYTTDLEWLSEYGCEYNSTKTALEEVQAESINAHKAIENGTLVIIKDGVRYNVLGAEL